MVVSTHLKNISQNGSFRQVRGENKKCLKPPPRDDKVVPFIVAPFGVVDFVRKFAGCRELQTQAASIG